MSDDARISISKRIRVEVSSRLAEWRAAIILAPLNRKWTNLPPAVAPVTRRFERTTNQTVHRHVRSFFRSEPA